MKVKSIKGNSTLEIIAALKESISDNLRTTLAFTKLSINQERKIKCLLPVQVGKAILYNQTYQRRNYYRLGLRKDDFTR